MKTTLTNKTILVTGANRGIGQALVAEALGRGARRVYAGTRQPMAHTDERVVPLALDITNRAQIEAAAEMVEGLDMLVNNAGTGLYDDLSNRAALEEHLAVNLFGPYDMVEAFLPALADPQRFGRQRAVDRLAGRAADHPFLLGVEGGGVLADPESAPPARPRRHQRPCGTGRADRHRHVPGLRGTQGLSAVRGRRHLRRRGSRRRGDLPAPHARRRRQSWHTGEIKSLERQFASFVAPAAVAS